MIDKNAKIYIAGQNVMFGSAIYKALTAIGYSNLLKTSSKELDLLNQKAAQKFFD
jgi:GDP-L-fucose synthase